MGYKDPYLYEWRRLNMLFSPVTIGKAIAMSFLPIGNKWMRSPTLERLERSQLTEKSEGLPGLEDIGVKLHTVTDKMVFELEFIRPFNTMNSPVKLTDPLLILCILLPILKKRR